ncbi:ParB/RepB/Spo0J family partition protein [Campylobacter hepaticus]|uniref:ParB/RepB/Spo0J family partition protein n=1 Tax=Campylobacter hepaticus TaxID=1813019 RepID=A0A424Z0W4_9BACT|nr:ParB/RepB/Spo0J family partition protein [Campylobacter hepaticus]AXP09160.1 ParB/RepB/Spo0J family partition protein [Campylobacter hepaticus]MCZ0771655.1 ParB/RepB/Spo0J family partition protein [Campylobacter hepaticus]MCZ0773123.1 ParB/RepB/Spo0J family partition protein [Campylobacter hepaticus]MCZ0775803.1 ParB/RepB/Spo0J family partition protein [Campylobacter hepaticus]MDX2323418.1 ParB/RepB/Spo0J family partition protein [Campylobacter hepaticus]
MGLNKNKSLSTLISDMDSVYSKELGFDKNQSIMIEVNKITPNPFQPRKNFNQEALEELANSIKEFGLIQPIIVLKKNDGFILVAGERRLRAVKFLEKKEILAFVADVDENKLRELALIENIQRENLNPIELANSYKDLMQVYKITQENLAKLIHKSRTQITNTLRLLNLDLKTQELIALGKISQGHAKVLVGLDKKHEKTLVDSIIGQKLNVRDTEKIVKKIKNNENLLDQEFENEMQKLKQILSRFGFSSKNKNSDFIIHLENIDKIQKLIKMLEKL